MSLGSLSTLAKAATGVFFPFSLVVALLPLFFRADLEGDDLFAELEGFWLQELPLLGLKFLI